MNPCKYCEKQKTCQEKCEEKKYDNLKAENERLKEKLNSITESGFWEVDEALELLRPLDINCTIDKTPKAEIKERAEKHLTAQRDSK